MPQFSLKHLFVSVTLMASGCASIGWFFQLLPNAQMELTSGAPSLTYQLLPYFFFMGFGLIGSGIGKLV